MGDKQASGPGCLRGFPPCPWGWMGAQCRPWLMGRYLAGHLFGLNLENLHEIITLHFFPCGARRCRGVLRAQPPRLSSSESCINAWAQQPRPNPQGQIETIFAASPFKNSIHLSSSRWCRAHVRGQGLPTALGLNICLSFNSLSSQSPLPALCPRRMLWASMLAAWQGRARGQKLLAETPCL